MSPRCRPCEFGAPAHRWRSPGTQAAGCRPQRGRGRLPGLQVPARGPPARNLPGKARCRRGGTASGKLEREEKELTADPNVLFQHIHGEAGRACKMEPVLPGRTGPNGARASGRWRRVLLALEEVVRFFMRCQPPPGDGHGRTLERGARHISFTVKKSIYLIKFPWSSVFPLSEFSLLFSFLSRASVRAEFIYRNDSVRNNNRVTNDRIGETVKQTNNPPSPHQQTVEESVANW